MSALMHEANSYGSSLLHFFLFRVTRVCWGLFQLSSGKWQRKIWTYRHAKKTATHTHLLLFPCPFKPFSKRSPLSTFNCYLVLVCQIVVVVYLFKCTSVLLFLLTMQEFKTMLYLHVCRSKTEKFVVFLSNFVLFMTSTSPIRLVYL